MFKTGVTLWIGAYDSPEKAVAVASEVNTNHRMQLNNILETASDHKSGLKAFALYVKEYINQNRIIRAERQKCAGVVKKTINGRCYFVHVSINHHQYHVGSYYTEDEARHVLNDFNTQHKEVLRKQLIGIEDKKERTTHFAGKVYLYHGIVLVYDWLLFPRPSDFCYWKLSSFYMYGYQQALYVTHTEYVSLFRLV